MRAGPSSQLDCVVLDQVGAPERIASAAPDPESLLVDEVRELTWRTGRVDVFVHGEAAEVRAVRQHLIADRGVDRDEASISPYWRRGETDENWRTVKRQWLADQANDA